MRPRFLSIRLTAHFPASLKGLHVDDSPGNRTGAEHVETGVKKGMSQVSGWFIQEDNEGTHPSLILLKGRVLEMSSSNLMRPCLYNDKILGMST